MAFEDLSKQKLSAAAVNFGVDFERDASKATITENMLADGITYADYERFAKEEEAREEARLAEQKEPMPELQETTFVKEEPAVVEKGDPEMVLLKMTRKNGSYQVLGYKFTKTHPYVLVREDHADDLIENVGGFAIASPKEARAYYG